MGNILGKFLLVFSSWRPFADVGLTLAESVQEEFMHALVLVVHMQFFQYKRKVTVVKTFTAATYSHLSGYRYG